jgi:hypothetical protein
MNQFINVIIFIYLGIGLFALLDWMRFDSASTRKEYAHGEEATEG